MEEGNDSGAESPHLCLGLGAEGFGGVWRRCGAVVVLGGKVRLVGVEKAALDQRDLDLGAHALDDVVELGGVVSCRSALKQVASLDRSPQEDVCDCGLCSAFDGLGVRAERGRTLLGQDVGSVSTCSAILEFPGVEGPPLIPGMHSFVLLG